MTTLHTKRLSDCIFGKFKIGTSPAYCLRSRKEMVTPHVPGNRYGKSFGMSIMNKMRKLLAAASMALCFSAPSSAALINLDTLVGWNILDEVGTTPYFFSNSYTTSVGRYVKVTDLYVWGDEYNYYINGVNMGAILAPSPAAAYNSDADSAYASGLFASATFWLGADDVLTFEETTIPAGYTDGTIAVSAGSTATVPEPASIGLLALSLIGMGAIRRRKQ